MRTRGKSRAAGMVDATAGAMKSATGGEDFARRAWDLNPRDFRLPVFKTGALGRYASPPWGNLPVGTIPIKIAVRTTIGFQRFNSRAQVKFESNREHVYRKDRDGRNHDYQITIYVDRIKDDKK